MEQDQFWGVNKKLTWMNMRMGALNESLVFGATMSTLQQEFRQKWNTITSGTVN